jgi:uncharacterized protein (TIGR02466 family)
MIEVSEHRVEQHFPTTVLIRTFAAVSELNGSLQQLFDHLEQNPSGDYTNEATLPVNTTQGGYQTKSGLRVLELDHPEIRQLRQEIVMPSIEHYLDDVLKVDPLFTPIEISSWVVSLGAGDWQAPHFHPTEYTLISGIYYVNVPKSTPPEGTLEFINPNLNAVSLGQQDASRNHQPKSGQIILFPPYYMHYVHPMRLDEKRRVVAFDVRLKTQP